MNRPNSTLLIVAGLLTCLPACVPSPDAGVDWRTVSVQVGRQTGQRSFAAACPVPTDKAAQAVIAREIDAAIKAKAPPDKLATEWLRLNDGARACRGTTN